MENTLTYDLFAELIAMTGPRLVASARLIQQGFVMKESWPFGPSDHFIPTDKGKDVQNRAYLLFLDPPSETEKPAPVAFSSAAKSFSNQELIDMLAYGSKFGDLRIAAENELLRRLKR